MLTDRDYHPVEIVGVLEETSDTRTFVLGVPPDLAPTFSYMAGQFCTFRATVGGDPVARCYSMSSSPEVGDSFAITVKRVPGGKMSNWMIDTLRPGDTIDVLRPAGLFVLRDAEAPVVAFAAGSGITPIFSIIKSALATTDRSILLVYANRDADSVIFADELRRLEEESAGRLVVHHHLDSQNGFLDPARCAELVEDRDAAHFYICGPGPYMDTVEAGLETLGVARSHVFIERFLVAGDDTSLVEASQTETLVIRLGRRKKTTEYKLGDTILEAARRAGLSPPSSCEGGSCATCMALIEQGSASMRVNNALTPGEVEKGWVLTCQALPKSLEVVVNYDA
jgi:ferredoxin-NADP reductase